MGIEKWGKKTGKKLRGKEICWFVEGVGRINKISYRKIKFVGGGGGGGLGWGAVGGVLRGKVP